jgi:predicted RNase H-like HicB family nuclease
MERKHFPVIIEQDEDGTYIVECPILQGCRSYGNTIDEAMNNISEAILSCIEDSELEQRNFIGVRDIELAIT